MNNLETDNLINEVLGTPENPTFNINSTIKMNNKIPIDLIDDFPKHPFKVIEDEDMRQLVQSIKEVGLINPPIVRKKDDGRFELISGHRRKFACKLAGLDKIPVVIKELDKDTATLLMVDSNMQREKILPSEKAFSYKMKLDALKRKAGRPKNNSCQVGANYRSDDLIAENSEESARNIQRYIRLTNLIPQLLQLVDDGRIALNPAVELSYLPKEQQKNLLTTIESEEATPSFSQAKKLRQLSEVNLDMDTIFSVLTEQKPNQVEKVSFTMDKFRDYFPKLNSPKEISDRIFQILDQWKHRQQQKAAQDRDAR